MSNKKNYHNKKAVEKLKTIAEAARICMMTTNLDKLPIHGRPMTLQEVDEDGILWFISSKESDTNYELNENSDTQLFFLNQSKNEYLSIYGKAEIYTDQITIEKHWSEKANAWFDGKEDSNVSIIGVRPLDVKYWGSKHGKFLDTALMLYDSISGDDDKDRGEKGKLNI